MTAGRRQTVRDHRTRIHRIVLVTVLVMTSASIARAQILGQLVSPGPLASAHADLEGVGQCQKCHQAGRKVMASLCLDCHKPVAERIRQKRGVHRDVKDDCVSCHTEHAGRDGVLRQFDTQKFDHQKETGYPLDGRHANIAKDCAKCHTTHSFLKAPATCVGCHADVHKPTLGQDCAKCHSVSVQFKLTEKNFDHSKAKFELDGAHTKVECAKCHVKKQWTGLKFAVCMDCHQNPHHKPFTSSTCASCHSTETWKSTKFDHGRFGYPLTGLHSSVACASCHVKPATKVALTGFNRCASCHQDPHKGGFKQDCASCHTVAGFNRPVASGFNHDRDTKFPLTGKHGGSLACAKCHKNTSAALASRTKARLKTVDFRGVSTTCVSCHADIHRGELVSTCDTCHSTASFKVPDFKHKRFPEFFAGQHRPVACASCHVLQPARAPRKPAAPVKEWSFKGVTTSCATCHNDVHLGQVSTQCETCHTVDAPKFDPVTFSHAKSAFKLTGKHERVECAKCHKTETASFPAGSGTAVRLKGVSMACSTCHQDRHLGQLSPKCDTCHSTSSFKVTPYTHKNMKTFFVGVHSKKACESCHKMETSIFPSGAGRTIRYTGIGTACTSCHADVHRGAMNLTCDTCHTPKEWATISRAFHKVGVFPLEGRHLTVECSSCHVNDQIKGTPSRCESCHWERRHDDPYETRLGVQCGTCHRPSSWSAVNWDHAAMTGVSLTPVHRSLGCDGCHKQRTFTANTVFCATCHQGEYNSTSSPNHRAAGFPTTCETCHLTTQTSWKQANFNHSQYFPLVGTHSTAACATCHKNSMYAGTPTSCAGCHQAQYNATTSPNHKAAGFPTACETCHNAAQPNWNATFNHSQFFALVGTHSTVACATCHVNNVFKGTARDCAGCHMTQFNSTTNPNHRAAGFAPSACEGCHNPSASSWNSGSPFNHSQFFPLVGTHATAACATCHVNNVFKGTARDCGGCHMAQFNATTNPNHRAAGFAPGACEGCHNPAASSFNGAGPFNHNQFFQLVGTHATATCTTCHVNSVFRGTPRDCAGCHMAQFNATTNPNHRAAGFAPAACAGCHNPAASSFSGAGPFNHSQFFQLVGRHATAPCATCHVNSVFKGTPRDCAGCHMAQFNATTNPNHQAAGFSPAACAGCHNPAASSFNGAGPFNHSQFYPLVGVHATIACATCHVNNVFHGTSRICSGCHMAQYNATTNPNHAAAMFPTTCDSCHNASSPNWTSSFNHSSIYPLVGVHATIACTTCHVNNVYHGTSRICSGCHMAQYNATTNPNHAAAMFPTTCDSCHNASSPNWTSSFNHNAIFPLLGRHATAACTRCHINNVYHGTPRTCFPCHQAQYVATTNPNHITAGFGTACEACHKATDTSFNQGTFNHTWFPIASGRHSGINCGTCHTNAAAYTVFTCMNGCHSQSSTDNEHRGRSGYRYDPVACYGCHPNGRADQPKPSAL